MGRTGFPNDRPYIHIPLLAILIGSVMAMMGKLQERKERLTPAATVGLAKCD
jgi:hypothetical protein